MQSFCHCYDVRGRYVLVFVVVMMFLCSSGNDCGFNLLQYFYKAARLMMDQNYFTKLKVMVLKDFTNCHNKMLILHVAILVTD